MKRSVSIVTPAAELPITAEELTDHARLTGAEPSDAIDALIRQAVEYVEAETNRTLITTTLKLTLDCFPTERVIGLPRPPLASVTAVTYLDTAGDEQTLDSSLYVVDEASTPGRLALKPTANWPDTIDLPAAVRVEYVAGYGDAGDDVPHLLRAAVKLVAAAWWNTPEAVAPIDARVVPESARRILDRFRFYEAV